MSHSAGQLTYKGAIDAVAFVCLMCLLAPALPASADAPPGRYTVASGTVQDTRTGLTWQRAVDANTYTQPNAISYCTGLTLAGGGWRLPKVSELLTLVDPTKSSPAIDATAFPSTPGGYFWSSSAYVGAGGAGDAWYVDFMTGLSSHSPTGSTASYRVRCVR